MTEAEANAPVTAIFKRRIKEGREEDFINWSKKITSVCSTFEGYVSTKLIQPTSTDGDYVTVITFDNYRHFQAWEESDQRRELLAGMADMVAGDIVSEQFIGVYSFIGNPAKRWPPDWCMVLVAYTAIWPLVYFVPPLLKPHLPQQPLLQSLLSTAVITVLMGYLSLPLMELLYRKLRRK